MSGTVSEKMKNRIEKINERDGTSWKIIPVQVANDWTAPLHINKPWDVIKEGDVGFGRFRLLEYKKLRRHGKAGIFGVIGGNLYTSISFKRHVWKVRISRIHKIAKVTKFMIEGMEDNKTYSRKEMNELLHTMERLG